MKLNFKSFGEGEPVLILHGLFGCLDNWQTLGKKLAENYKVYLLDLRNHGKSLHQDMHNYKVMSQDVKEFVVEQELSTVNLIGHSMGGKVAMQFAISHPECVTKLIVVDIAPKQYPPHHHEILAALNSVPIESISSRGEADKIISERISDLGVRMFLLKNLTRKKEGGYAWKMNLSVLSEGYHHILASTYPSTAIDVNSVFIRGGASQYILDSDYKDIETNYSDSIFYTVDGAGHWVHATHSAELLKILKNELG